MIGKLERSIAETKEALAKAEAAGDAKKVKDLQGKLESNESFLAMAQAAAADFG